MKCAIGLLLLSLPLLAGCAISKQTAGDVAVSLTSEPRPPRVGENLLKARVSARNGTAIPVSSVRFHYYPFVYRDKDSLALPDEVVRVMDAEKSGDDYRVRATFDKPGPWKVTLKIIRPDTPETLVTFTYDVRA